MAATPKHRKSNRLRAARRAHKKAEVPQLVRLENGRYVPMHTVTKLNPEKKGIKFIATK
jgi:ribosomal protein L32